jgi:hypothetical protein
LAGMALTKDQWQRLFSVMRVSFTHLKATYPASCPRLSRASLAAIEPSLSLERF